MHGATAVILAHLELLGRAVSVHRVNVTIGMHAVLLAGPDVYHVARCDDGVGDEEAYRCGCLVPRAVGIDLEDG